MTAVEMPAGYAPTGGAVDETFDAEGAVRPAYAAVLAALEAASPATAAETIAAGVQRDSVVHGADDSAHPLNVDALPRVFAADEWTRLAAGLEQRVAALEAFVADAFGAREAFRAGVVPADLLDRCPWFEHEIAALPQRGPRIGVAGPDVVRDAQGELRVLEDNIRTPTLMAFALAARRLVAPTLPGAPPPRPIEDALRSGLLELGGGDAAVILGREPGNLVWWELEQLAQLTGWPLVGLDDLAQRDGRVVLREDGSRVDLVWRRTNEDRLRGDDGELTTLGSLLLDPLRRGTVRVLNAFGTGVADDKRTYVYVERLVRFFCGAEPLLRSVPAWDLAVDEQRAEALARL
ncbi:MAG TPA: circularly permuted type 2 ATP-grasp protein, partial [Solirubrobacteraceae bacterium]|nr:circularly permuted type 2 ATP-grasp protein [Solirubrobacteraceae bacterium]